MNTGDSIDPPPVSMTTARTRSPGRGQVSAATEDGTGQSAVVLTT